MVDKKIKGKLFRKPYGPSEIPDGAFGWNNEKTGTIRKGVLCELCGTEHDPVGDESIGIGRFLGLQFVEHCCGAAVDQLYGEFGEEFATQFLREFSHNPTDPRFGVFLRVLEDYLAKAEANLAEAQGSVEKCRGHLADKVN